MVQEVIGKLLRLVFYQYDFSFNEVGHIEIAVSLLDKTSLNDGYDKK